MKKFLKYFENNEKYAFFYDEQQQKWYYRTAQVRVYFEKPKEEVKYGDDPKSIVKKLFIFRPSLKKE